MNSERWLIGRDPDGTLFLQLTWALRKFGFIMDPDWDVSDLANFPLTGPSGSILIQTETPEGLAVTGPSELISRLREQFMALSHPNSTLE
jgi:hypothetical protein